MEAVIRVAVIVFDAVMETETETNLKVQLQPTLNYHATFTDFYFIIKENGTEIPKGFIEVKNVSKSVNLGADIKPVAQALPESQIILDTFPNISLPFILTRSFGLAHMSSGWFDYTEPSLSTSLQGKQGVQGAYALVRGGSSTSNLVEPSRTTSLQR